MRKDPKPKYAPPKKIIPWLFWYKCVTCEKLIKHEPLWRYRNRTVCCECAETPKIAIGQIKQYIKYGDINIEDD